ncbi:MAG: BTAD domain-containing putative transcriptional regulator [Gemmatimonadaceae bacterium]
MLRLLTFGGLSLTDDGVAVTGAASQRSRLALLALLAAAGPAGLAREKVLACLWPESADERARHALKQAVYALRRDLGSEHAISGTATLCLDATLITSDLREFEEALARGDDAAAVAVYAGAFLDGVFVRGSSEFDQWAGVERARLERAYLDAIARLARAAEANGDVVSAVQWWRRGAAAEPLSGRVALSLMRTLAESGDVSAAMQHARVHDAMVRAELDSPADDAVLALAEELRRGDWVAPVRVSREAPVVRPSPAAGTALAEVVPAPAGVAAEPPAPAPVVTAPRRPRWVLAAVIIATLLAVAVGGALARDQVSSLLGKPGVPKSSRRIVVASFVNQTGDTALNHLGEMATDFVGSRLVEAEFEVYYRPSAMAPNVVALNAVNSRIEDRAAALAKETGAATLVMGSYFRQGDTLQLEAKVLDPARMEVVKVVGPVSGPQSQQSKLVDELAGKLAVAMAILMDRSPGSATASLITAPTVEAYVHAERGWEMFFAHPADTVAAFAEFARALKIDTAYTTPRLMRAYVLDVKEQWPDLAAAVNDLNSRRTHMGRIELEALALYEADLRGDLLGRLRASQALLRLSPGSVDMSLLVAVSASYLHRPDDVMEVLQKSSPDSGINTVTPMYFAWRAEAEHSLEHFAEEQRSAEAMIARFPSQLYGAQALTRALAARGDTVALFAHLHSFGFTDKETSDDGRGLALLAARELRAHGRPLMARPLFARIAATPPGPRPSRDARLDQALALYETGALPQARMAFESLLAADPGDIAVVGRLGAIAARLADSAGVRQAEDRLAAWPAQYAFGRPIFWRAHIAALTGRGSEAVRMIHAAIDQGLRAMDLNIITLHEEPDFMALWSDPGFHELVKPHKGQAISP